jgi:shikimate kinase
VVRESNRRALRRFGYVVWLTADPSVLAERLRHEESAGASRPALTAAGTLGEIEAVLRARIPFYQEVCDAVVDTQGKTPTGVAEAVMSSLPCGFRALL